MTLKTFQNLSLPFHISPLVLNFSITFFCLYLIASFNRSRVWRSPGSQYSRTLPPLQLSMISSSCEVRAWSRRAVANSWHCCLISQKSNNQNPNSFPNFIQIPTLYSSLNSFSILLSLLSSQDSSKAVRIGSFELSAIRELDDSALYALIRACECLNESWSLDTTHSSQPHLYHC